MKYSLTLKKRHLLKKEKLYLFPDLTVTTEWKIIIATNIGFVKQARIGPNSSKECVEEVISWFKNRSKSNIKSLKGCLANGQNQS